MSTAVIWIPPLRPSASVDRDFGGRIPNDRVGLTRWNDHRARSPCIARVERAYPIRDPVYRERFLSDLRRAGLPD